MEDFFFLRIIFSSHVRVDDRAKQVKTGNKDLDKVTCYNCRKKGHFSKDCRVPKKDLKYVWCATTGFHNTNDYCKSKMAEKEKSGEAEKGKADQVKAGDKSPVGHGKDQEEDAKQVNLVQISQISQMKMTSRQPLPDSASLRSVRIMFAHQLTLCRQHCSLIIHEYIRIYP